MNESADAVFEDWRRRADAGETVDPEAVVRAHPDLADDLQLRFEALRMLEGVFAKGRASRPPERLGDYRILRELGRGGMGVVYEAEQESMRRRVALKVLYPSVAPSTRAVDRFEQEARIAGRLKHSNIVAVYALGRQAGLWYCAMELVEGAPLSQVLAQVRAHGSAADAAEPRSGPPSTLTGETPGGSDHYRRAARMFAEIADALAIVHDAGVLHRDVKPSNLLLDHDGHLRLVDFGLARLADGDGKMTRTGDVVGTPLYMSPEQALGLPASPASDVFSLGATLYEVLTTHPPREPSEAGGVSAQALAKDPIRPRALVPNIPRDLETVVLKALERAPADRYASATAFAEDLRAFAAGDAIRAKRAHLLSRAVRAVRRRPGRTLVAVALLIAIGAAAVLASDARRDSRARRDAEYDLLLQRAVVLGPEQEDDGRSQTRALYEQAIALDPDRSQAFVARALTGGPPWQERLRDVDRAGERGVPPGTAALLRAYVLESHGKVPEAERALRDAGDAATSGDPMDRLVAGRRAEPRADLAGAEQAYEDALARLPRGDVLRPLVQVGLVHVHLRQEAHAKALDDLHALQALGDRSARLAALEPWLWRRMGKEEEATARASALIERALEDESSAVTVAAAWEGRCAWDWMDRLTERAVGRYPTSSALWNLRAGVFEPSLRWDDAIAALDRSIAADPTRPEPRMRRAQALARAGRIPAALAASEQVLAMAPDDPDLMVRRAEVLLRAGDAADAEALARKALGLAPQHAVALQLVATVCTDHADRLAEAEALLRPALEASPGDPKLAATLGLLRERQARWADALTAFERALAVDPTRAAYHRGRARALSGLNRKAEAERSYRRALELSPKDESVRHGLATLLANTGRAAEAVPMLRALVADFPRRTASWSELGNALRKTGDATGALAAYEEALKLAPDDLIYVANKAAVLEALDRAGEALPLLLRVVAAKPESFIDRFNLAIAYNMLGKEAEALAEYARCMRLDPADYGPHLETAIIHAEHGRLDEALEAYAKAEALAPKDPSIPHDAAIMLLRAKRYPEAEAAARRSVALAPRDGSSHALVGHLRLLQDDAKGSVEHLERACALAPEVSGYCVDLAAAYADVGREGAAVDLLTDAVRRLPDAADVHLALGWYLSDAARDPTVRDPVKAALHARRATDLAGTDPKGWLALGAALYRQARFSEAIASLEKARTLGAELVEPAASQYLAMALRRAGRVGDARAALERADATLSTSKPPHDTDVRRAREAAGVVSAK